MRSWGCSLLDGISVFTDGEEAGEKVTERQGKSSERKTTSVLTLILDFLASKTVRNKYLLLKLPVCCSPSWLITLWKSNSSIPQGLVVFACWGLELTFCDYSRLYLQSVSSLLSVATEAPEKDKINRSCFFKFPPAWGALQPMVVEISVPTSQQSKAPIKTQQSQFLEGRSLLPTLAPTGHVRNTWCRSTAASYGFVGWQMVATTAWKQLLEVHCLCINFLLDAANVLLDPEFQGSCFR